MGVYIKGMEMPTTCGKCKIKNAIECNRWKLVRSVTLDRHRDCPLVNVPPHGDLIDRDSLFVPYDICDGEEAMGFINTAPTIIPADPAEEGE